MSSALKPGARVGVCPVCEQNALLEPAEGRWEMPTVVAQHHDREHHPCPGQGQHTLSRARAWGWPQWEHMSTGDQQSALVHMMRCPAPCSARAGHAHVGALYQGRGLRELPAHLMCLHAWDQTGGWQAALERWGVEQVRSWVSGRVPVAPEAIPDFYGWGDQCQTHVEGDQVVGVLATRDAVRPKGWLWRQSSNQVPVAVPDRRSARGRAIAHHLMVVEPWARVRVREAESNAHLGEELRRALVSWRPIEVQVHGGWATVQPVLSSHKGGEVGVD